MELRRWTELQRDDKLSITTQEFAERWHFCWEWDGLLVGPGMEEMNCCTCFKDRWMRQEAPDFLGVC